MAHLTSREDDSQPQTKRTRDRTQSTARQRKAEILGKLGSIFKAHEDPMGYLTKKEYSKEEQNYILGVTESCIRLKCLDEVSLNSHFILYRMAKLIVKEYSKGSRT